MYGELHVAIPVHFKRNLEVAVTYSTETLNLLTMEQLLAHHS